MSTNDSCIEFLGDDEETIAVIREEISKYKFSTACNYERTIYFTVGLAKLVGAEFAISYDVDVQVGFQLIRQLGDRVVAWHEMKRKIRAGRVEGWPVYFQPIDRKMFDEMTEDRHNDAIPECRDYKSYQIIMPSFHHQRFPWEGMPTIEHEAQQNILSLPASHMH
jgi:hypothetical protein